MSTDGRGTRHPARRALLDSLARGRAAEQPKTPRAVVSRPGALAPASCGQEGLWFIDQFAPGSTQYTIPLAFRMRGPLSPDALRHALTEVVARHAVLRTRFVDDDGEPRQRHTPPTPVPLPVEDLSGHSAPTKERTLRARLAALARQTFDLAEGPLFVASLLRLAEDHHVLLVNVHHIVFDGWSQRILLDELVELYEDRLGGRAASLAPLPLQYTDHAAWERDWLDGEQGRAQYDYWCRRLDGVPRLDLPTDRPRTQAPSDEGASVPFELDRHLRDRLLTVGAEERATPFMVLLAAFQLLLSQAGGQRDVAVGTPMANRVLPGTRQLIGYFVNTVVLRTDLRGDMSFRETLARVRDVVLEGFDNQNYPFSRLVAQLAPERASGRSPFFDAYFIMLDDASDHTPWPGLTLEPVELPDTNCVFDLTLVTTLTAHGITGELNFRTDLFDHERMEKLTDEFIGLLGRVLGDPGADLSSLL